MKQASFRMAVAGWACLFLTVAPFAVAGPDLDLLLNAASSFSITIGQQLQMVHSNPSLELFAGKTLDYAEAEAAYFDALRAALPLLSDPASAEEERSAAINKFAAALAVAGEGQEKAADSETLKLFARFGRNPGLEKARAAFERAQKAEQSFRKDYDALGLNE
jgi:hypothetical protein